MKKYLFVMVLCIICSPKIYAYDTNYSLHGARSSFLLGKIYDSKFNTTLMYLSNTWTAAERAQFRQRLLHNGDTHIDVYARASSGVLPGGIVDPNENLREKLVELNTNGLKPILWLTGEQRHKDYKLSDAEHRTFFEKTIAQSDDQVAAYVICLECDEYWSAEQVNEYVAFIKSKTNKPVAVHLAPGVGGYKGDINYYKEADYILLQIGDHLTGDYVADVELAKRMLAEALKLGKPVIANEYSLYSESPKAKALGDLMCQMGAVGTGNGRSITFCGYEEPSKKYKLEDDILKVAGVGLLAFGAYYLWNNYDFTLSMSATEDFQTYGTEKSFTLTDSVNLVFNYEYRDFHNYEDNAIMFSVNGTW